MKRINWILSIGAGILLLTNFCAVGTTIAAGVPAFPGAEGFGSLTPGGRGGRVIEVTNLNASGPGSFLEACEASGPRIVVFRTGGTIEVNADIEIKNPYITIAGQTAPGDGICIKGAALRIPTHDVIIRGLRIRVGDNPDGPNPDQRDGIGIDNPNEPTYNIIVDHCSLSWSLDENFATCWVSHDITLQWCIISEALLAPDDESYGVLIGTNSNNISVHHCLLAHNKDRSPLVNANATAEFINNVIYNWRWYATRMYSGGNIIGNYYKPGPNWTGGKGIVVEDIAGVKIFVKDNIGPGKESNTGDDWLAVNAADTHRSATTVTQPSGITPEDTSGIYEPILHNAGALNPSRDSVDARIVQSVRDGTGKLIWSQDEVGGWPTYNVGQPLTDTDHDGMPDAWELAHGFNPNTPSDGSQSTSGDGYTNIENYINSLIPSTKSIAAPTSLFATAQSASRIDLSWVASANYTGVAGYNIYRDGVMIGVSQSTTYQDTGLSANSTYTYCVCAFNATGHESAKSASASATTLDNTYTITVTAGSNGSISPSGAVSVDSGASKAFTITPNANYQVANVLLDGTSVGAVASYTFNNVTANHTISATFALQQITVASPKSGELWKRGTPRTITWKYTGNPGTKFQIQLYRNTYAGRIITKKATIGNNGSGSVSWNLPGNLAEGDKCRIKISVADNDGVFNFSGYFSITK